LPPCRASPILSDAMDIPSFLRRYPPFDALDDAALARVVLHTRIEFHPGGDVILNQGGEPSRFLYVIRTGAVELLDEGQVLDLLTEGEVFGHPSLLAGSAPTLTCRAHEDTIVYLMDTEVAEEILGTHSGLAFLSMSLRRRVIRALEGLDPESVDPWQTRVGALVRRPPITAPLTFSVREAAELMSRERVSSLLVERADGFGIITDRDLRSRVLAPGRSPDTHIGEVMSWPALTVPHDSMVAELSALMLERGVHHVPVTDEAGTVIGVVTDVDLMGLEQRTPFLLKTEIERAATPDELMVAGRRLPATVATLVDANVEPTAVGHTIAVAIDAMTRRSLELGIGKLGDPPCPWTWLALGSEARQEQSLKTDQDNALVVDPHGTTMAEVDPYFAALAAFVNEQLERAGIPRCKAGVIASNEEWRNTPSGWVARFTRWIDERTWMSGALSAITFDYRSVAGPLQIEASFDEIIRAASGEPRFIRRLGETALAERPPSGFLRDLVIPKKGETVSALDVKAGGITPITNLARVYSIMSGLTENRTLRRLAAVTELGRIAPETREGLEEAFRLLWQTRLEHQVHQIGEGQPADDMVDPRALGPLARQGLKEAFRMIDRAQEQLAGALGIGR
jgi:CBS domain-containing protein